MSILTFYHYPKAVFVQQSTLFMFTNILGQKKIAQRNESLQKKKVKNLSFSLFVGLDGFGGELFPERGKIF